MFTLFTLDLKTDSESLSMTLYYRGII